MAQGSTPGKQELQGCRGPIGKISTGRIDWEAGKATKYCQVINGQGFTRRDFAQLEKQLEKEACRSERTAEKGEAVRDYNMQVVGVGWVNSRWGGGEKRTV